MAILCSTCVQPLSLALSDTLRHTGPCPAPARVAAVGVEAGKELGYFGGMFSMLPFQCQGHELDVFWGRCRILLGKPSACHHTCLKVLLIFSFNWLLLRRLPAGVLLQIQRQSVVRQLGTAGGRAPTTAGCRPESQGPGAGLRVQFRHMHVLTLFHHHAAMVSLKTKRPA